MHFRDELLTLVSEYRTVVHRSEATISNWIVGHARLFKRLRDDKGCNASTVESVRLWFSENWPEELAWPDEITRPEEDPEVKVAR